jgi:hypothetical protein
MASEWIWSPWDTWRDACLEHRLTRNQRRFVLVIARLVEMTPAGRESLSCDPSRSMLKEAIGGKVDQKAVKRIAEGLERLGLLEIVQGGGSHASRTTYRIVPPDCSQGAETPSFCPLTSPDQNDPQGAKTPASCPLSPIEPDHHQGAQVGERCPLTVDIVDQASGGKSEGPQGAPGTFSGGRLARGREPEAIATEARVPQAFDQDPESVVGAPPAHLGPAGYEAQSPVQPPPADQDQTPAPPSREHEEPGFQAAAATSGGDWSLIAATGLGRAEARPEGTEGVDQIVDVYRRKWRDQLRRERSPAKRLKLLASYRDHPHWPAIGEVWQLVIEADAEG